MESFSNQLRRAIDESGKTRYRLAIEAEIDHATFSRFHNGLGGLSLAGLDRLCAVLGLRLVASKRTKTQVDRDSTARAPRKTKPKVRRKPEKKGR